MGARCASGARISADRAGRRDPEPHQSREAAKKAEKRAKRFFSDLYRKAKSGVLSLEQEGAKGGICNMSHKLTEQEYQKMAERAAPGSPVVKNVLLAYVSGGAICCLGQALFLVFSALGLPETQARGFVSVTLIGLSAALTALGVYDNIAAPLRSRHAGADHRFCQRCRVPRHRIQERKDHHRHLRKAVHHRGPGDHRGRVCQYCIWTYFVDFRHCLKTV